MQLPNIQLPEFLNSWKVLGYTALGLFIFFLVIFILLWWKKRRYFKKIQKKNETDFIEGMVILPTDKRDYVNLDELKQKSISPLIHEHLAKLPEIKSNAR